MAGRKTRSDCRVGTFEKKNGIPSGSIRHTNGRDVRSDMKIGTLRKQIAKGIFSRLGKMNLFCLDRVSS